jgi:hypothetical protein
MGSSTAAVWLSGVLNEGVDFYVDEDPGRAGGALLGKPIYTFADVPKDAAVFIPMSAAVASGIVSRAPQTLHFDFVAA